MLEPFAIMELAAATGVIVAAVAGLLRRWKRSGFVFEVFYNKGHPEKRKKDLTQYNALEQVAHLYAGYSVDAHARFLSGGACPGH